MRLTETHADEVRSPWDRPVVRFSLALAVAVMFAWWTWVAVWMWRGVCHHADGAYMTCEDIWVQEHGGR